MCECSICITFYYHYCVTRNKCGYYYSISRLAMYAFVVKSCWRTGILHFYRSIRSSWKPKYVSILSIYSIFMLTYVSYSIDVLVADWLAGAFWVQFCCRVLSVFVLRTMRLEANGAVAGADWSCYSDGCWWCLRQLDDIFWSFSIITIAHSVPTCSLSLSPFQSPPLRKMCI